MNIKNLVLAVSYLVVGTIGAGIMYGVWYVNDAEQIRKSLASSRVDLQTCQQSLVDAKANTELLKENMLR